MLHPIITNLHGRNLDRSFPLWAAYALHHHVNRTSAALMMRLWDACGDARLNPRFGELFNRMADRNFGMDRDAIRAWTGQLPE